jgi:hypothetical protein
MLFMENPLCARFTKRCDLPLFSSSKPLFSDKRAAKSPCAERSRTSCSVPPCRPYTRGDSEPPKRPKSKTANVTTPRWHNGAVVVSSWRTVRETLRFIISLVFSSDPAERSQSMLCSVPPAMRRRFVDAGYVHRPPNDAAARNLDLATRPPDFPLVV